MGKDENGIQNESSVAHIASLTSILTQYTVQIDEYHKVCVTVSLALLTFVGVLLTVCGTVYVNINAANRQQFLSIMAFVTLIIPTVGTMVMYVNNNRFAL